MKIQSKMGYLAAGIFTLLNSPLAQACNDDSYIGTVCLTAAVYCPSGTLEANGQQLNVSQYQALYALVGNTYGGNGSSTFNLPDLRGRVPVGMGQGAGLTPIKQGEQRGNEKVTLTTAQLPAHTHALNVSPTQGTSQAGNDTWLANIKAEQGRTPVTATNFQPSASAGTPTAINGGSIANTGGGQPISIVPPELGLRYCIVVNGLFPPRD